MSESPRNKLQSLFGRKAGFDGASTASSTLQVGDRYYKIGRWESVWTIQRLFTPEGSTTLHAKIVREAAPSDTTILSTAVLLDPNCFRPDRRIGEDKRHGPPWRRRSDDPRLRD